jgi:hypothetical protein
VTKPDGTGVDVPANAPGAASVSFSATDLLGVYSATPIGATATTGPSGSGSAGGAPSALAGGSAAPGSSAGVSPGAAAGSAPSTNGSEPVRFAVDLFDPGESDIAPGSAAAIAALGSGAAGSAAPGASGASSAAPATSASASPTGSGAPGAGTAAGAADRQPARDELWIPIVLVVLAILIVEWLVYQRDAVTRIWRGVRGIRGAPDARGTGRQA